MFREKDIRTFLDLLRCSVTGRQPAVPPSDTDWEMIYQTASIQRLVPTLYFGLSKLPKSVAEQIPQWNLYLLAYKKALVADANRAFEIQNLSTDLTNQGIDFVFLKGSVTKYLYPDPAMRPMADIDILYRKGDFPALKTLFQEQGYVFQKKDPDEISFFKPVNKIKVEMQQKLIDRGYVKWYDYLNDIWDHCVLKKNSSHEYEMSHEFFYIYHIIHMAKHFRKGGIGFNQCMDLYMMLQSGFLTDWEFVHHELQQLGLDAFAHGLHLLIDSWFYDKKLSKEETITVSLLREYIIQNGAFGRMVQEEINHAVIHKKEKLSMRSKIFPDYHTMNSYYGGLLSRFPFLLPFYWVKLNLKRLFSSRKDFHSLRHSLSSVTDSSMEKTRELMKRCGFDT